MKGYWKGSVLIPTSLFRLEEKLERTGMMLAELKTTLDQNGYSVSPTGFQGWSARRDACKRTM